MLLSGARIIMECLLEQGVDTVFGFPGGQIMPLYDALYDYTSDGRVRHVLTAHEQGATHAADGYARSTGRVGVCFATSGPGATNTVTGIATAYMDSSPIIVITGQVPLPSIGRDSFQEVDIVGITLPVVKHSYFCKQAAELAPAVRQAFRIAASGRPGPVLIDVPKNLMVESCEYAPAAPLPLDRPPEVSMRDIERLAALINGAERPVIYAGGGVVISGASGELRALAEKSRIPVATTLMCLGAIDRRSPLSLGMAGMHGETESNMAVSSSDLLLSIGARFSDRVTGDIPRFAKGAAIAHIDIDLSEIGKNVASSFSLVGDVREILARLLPLVEENSREEWNGMVRGWKRDAAPASGGAAGGLGPDEIFAVARRLLGEDITIATDVGQHQMWTAQKWPFSNPRRLITSGGLGTMGFGLGAAIGAQMANPDRRVVLFTGDGSFRMNCVELATVSSQGLPIIVFVLKNGTLGMVRQWQKLFFGRRFSATDLPDVIDYPRLAEAFGLRGWRVGCAAELERAVAEALEYGRGAVIACDIDIDENVWPIVPPGDAIHNQVTGEG
ncbi:MAG: biosynthetic-type acetolactate synthase large subunit [Clostridiales Family XIII bacterium]|jgi:acetolactate synthase-1/2/3 large subunit|nr:biosynthetic-type acetolactate synthase large subunit [Clostridiales Family XIII bacterium]